MGWGGQNNAEIRFCHCQFQFFNNSLPFGWELTQDERLQSPTPKHRLKLVAGVWVMAIYDKKPFYYR
ncbi:hypothetical protein BPIT_29380 [Candidatus Brocadia pituitae]|nr:hypothetical protein BPIT_29380 [Candidatus Brocadia pituitae]